MFDKNGKRIVPGKEAKEKPAKKEQPKKEK